MEIMRLTTNNIKFVIEYTCDGITYKWFVGMKSNRMCDSRKFDCKRFQLPKAVQKFLDNHSPEVFEEDEWKGSHYIRYIYR